MKEATIKKFTILLSAPSDVFKYTTNVKKAIDKYNNELGFYTGILFEQKNWKENVYPEYGEQAQDIINKQIVSNCDIVIALFGARIGTPTQNHESGTIEEIIQISEMGGEALTFFARGKLVKIEDIDPEQLKRLTEFKTNYLGIYNEFTSTRHLEDLVYTALKNLSIKLKNSNAAELQLKSYADKEVSSSLRFSLGEYTDCELVEDLRNEILAKINSIKKINFAKPIPVKQTAHFSQLEKKLGLAFTEDRLNNMAASVKALGVAFPSEAVQFGSEEIISIKKFCKENDIDIDESFFDVGDAVYVKDVLGQRSLQGGEKETQKVKLIEKLCSFVQKYNGLKQFLSFFDNKYRLVLVLENVGGTYCEDIDLVIDFETQYFNDLNELEFTEIQSAKVLEDFVEVILKPQETTEIEAMKEGREIIPSFVPQPYPSFMGVTAYTSPNVDFYNDKLLAEIKNVYPYIINSKNGRTYIKLNVGNLKQFTSTFVCGALIFDKPIEELKYTITSKSIGRKIEATIKYSE